MSETFDGWAGMQVIEREGFKKPLPLVAITWGQYETEWAPGQPTGELFGPRLFESLRVALKARYTKRMRWHRFEHPVYETSDLFCRLLYRDSQHDESLYLNLESPKYFQFAAMENPEAAAIIRSRQRIPPLLDGAKLPDADENWFKWKAAYQDCGYYAIAYGDLVGPPENGDWRMRWGTVPMFICNTVDYSEIGPFEKIMAETAAAKLKLRMEGGQKV